MTTGQRWRVRRQWLPWRPRAVAAHLADVGFAAPAIFPVYAAVATVLGVLAALLFGAVRALGLRPWQLRVTGRNLIGARVTYLVPGGSWRESARMRDTLARTAPEGCGEPHYDSADDRRRTEAVGSILAGGYATFPGRVKGFPSAYTRKGWLEGVLVVDGDTLSFRAGRQWEVPRPRPEDVRLESGALRVTAEVGELTVSVWRRDEPVLHAALGLSPTCSPREPAPGARAGVGRLTT